MPPIGTPEDNAFDFTAANPTGSTTATPGDTEPTDIYLAALAHPVLRTEDLLRAGFNEADISESIPLMEARGMIRRLDNASWRVLPPDIVLPAYAMRLEDQARSVRSSVTAMARLFEQSEERSRGLEAFEGIRIMTTLADVRQGIARIVGTARSHVMTAYADSPVCRELLNAGREVHQRDLLNSSGDPIHVQANYSDALMGEPALLEVMRWRAMAGEEQRVTPGMRLTCMANDTGLSLVDLQDENGGPHGLMISDAAFSQAISDVCRWAWPIGVPWRNETSGDPAARGAPQSQRILQMMAAGASDAAIARHLGVSQRTVERRVRAIMDQLSTTTRFQAGVVAARQNLL